MTHITSRCYQTWVRRVAQNFLLEYIVIVWFIDRLYFSIHIIGVTNILLSILIFLILTNRLIRIVLTFILIDGRNSLRPQRQLINLLTFIFILITFMPLISTLRFILDILWSNLYLKSFPCIFLITTLLFKVSLLFYRKFHFLVQFLLLFYSILSFLLQRHLSFVYEVAVLV